MRAGTTENLMVVNRTLRHLLVLVVALRVTEATTTIAVARVLNADSESGIGLRQEHGVLTESKDHVFQRHPLQASVKRHLTASVAEADGDQVHALALNLGFKSSTQAFFQSDFYVGVLLECFGQLLNVSGKHAIGHGRRLDNQLPICSWAFWSGVGLWYLLGSALVICYIFMDIFALSYADQTIITACSGTSVVWNSLLAPVTLGEAITSSRLIGACIIVTGTVCVAIFGNHITVAFTQQQYLILLSQPEAIAFYIAWTVGFVILILLLWNSPEEEMARTEDDMEKDKEQGSGVSSTNGGTGSRAFLKPFRSKCLALPTDRNVRGFVWGMLSGYIAGNAWCTKTFSSLAFSSSAGFGSPLTWLFGFIALSVHLAALLIVFWALKFYDALVVVTASDSFNIVIGAFSGLLVLQEANFPPLPAVNLAFYIIAVLIIVSGLLWILIKPFSKTDEPVPCCISFYHCLGFSTIKSGMTTTALSQPQSRAVSRVSQQNGNLDPSSLLKHS